MKSIAMVIERQLSPGLNSIFLKEFTDSIKRINLNIPDLGRNFFFIRGRWEVFFNTSSGRFRVSFHDK